MRYALIALTLAAMVHPASAELLSESFTDTMFPPPGWATYNNDGGRAVWQREATHAYTPPACAACEDERDRTNSDWLCTPAVFPNGADTLLAWWCRGLSIGHQESLSVWISTTDQRLPSFTNFVKGVAVNSNSYLPETVSLAAYAGQRIFLGLEYCSDTMQLNIYVDDVAGPTRFLKDVGVTSILAPPDTGYAGILEYPSVNVYNYGDSLQTGFPVHVAIRDSATGEVVYDDSAIAGTVMPESTITVTLTGGWTPVEGTYLVESFTALVGDLRPENDTTVKKTTVVRLDVGATAILAPFGTIDSGTVVTPTAVAHNFGPLPATFPAVLRIGGVYDETVTGITLDPGETDTVAFPDWVAEPVGVYPTIAFTNLSVDADRTNDTVYGTDTVRVVYPPHHDVGAIAILAPTGTLDSGSVVTPRAVVGNYGNRRETLPAVFRIGSVYDDTVPAITLEPGQHDTVDFPDWVAQPVGDYWAMSFTDLANDENRSNDTVFGAETLHVVYPERHDVGATAILAPLGTVDSGTVIAPQAVIRNFGTRDEVFLVSFIIGTVYSQIVSARLVPGQSNIVSFPNWTAQPLGAHATTAFTSLANDRNRSNDTIRNQVTVQLPPRHDVGATAILAPAGTLDSGTVVTPRVVVRNFGTRNETFPVRLTIEGGYSGTLNSTLNPGETDTLSFPDWIAEPLGSLGVVAFTDLAGDENRSNDTLVSRVIVQRQPRHDVGATSILAPVGTIDSGTVVTPQVVIRNFGTRSDTFPATFTISGVYDQTVAGIALTPGQIDTVDFPYWVAQPVGEYRTVSFTGLAADENRANDTVFGAESLHVLHPERHDVGAAAVLAPHGTIDSGTVITPQAVIHNYGTRDETFPVTFRIGDVYSQTLSASLSPGRYDTLDFPGWTAEPVGGHAALALTDLAGDENRANDTAVSPDTVNVVRPARHDVGATVILAPLGTADSGMAVTPQVVVCNFGTRDEDFPITFTVGSAYIRTVQASLIPGQTDTVDFPDWIAQPVGRYLAVAFTELDGDEYRANDTAYGAESLSVILPVRHDVGATAVLAPMGSINFGTAIAPQAVVRNFGTNEDEFPVTFTISSGYSQTIQVRLGPGGTVTVAFPGWTAEPFGQHAVTCFTDLEGDRDWTNDTARATVTVERLSDVGTEAVLQPTDTAQLAEGVVRTTLKPKARIVNSGQRAEANFRVRFRIDSVAVDSTNPGNTRVYEQTVDIGPPLEAGASTELEFPEVTLGFGNYTASCSTMLAGDQLPANNRSAELFTVKSSASSDQAGTFAATIYTRAGERVRVIENKIGSGDPLLVQWDGRNDRGTRVAPGIYICLLQFDAGGSSQQQTTKMLVTDNITSYVLTWRKP